MSCSDIAEYDFTLYQGDDRLMEFLFRQDDGTPYNIYNYTIQLVTPVTAIEQNAAHTPSENVAWDVGTTYAIDDPVYYEGADYTTDAISTGDIPGVSANWVLASNLGGFSFSFSAAETLAITERRFPYEVVFWPTGLLGLKETKFRGYINITQKAP